jgi:hypothetical protein
MGYESRLYVVEKGITKHKVEGKEYVWAEKIAIFNLCKVRAVSDKMRMAKNTDCFIYDDGDTEVVTDCYGDALKEMTIKEAIQILEEAAEKDDYRRYAPCISLLKGFNESQWQNLAVLHYGY